MAVCSEIHTKHINALCGLNVELLNVKRRRESNPLPTFSICQILLKLSKLNSHNCLSGAAGIYSTKCEQQTGT